MERNRKLITGDIGRKRGLIRNKPIQLQNGREFYDPASVDGKRMESIVDISENNGESFVEVIGLKLQDMRNLT